MTQQNICDQLLVVAAGTFKMPPEAMSMDLKAGMIGPWDSLGHLQLFMAIEEKWGINFTAVEIVNLTSLKAIAESIERHVQEANQDA